MKHVSIALASFALIAPAAAYGQSLGPSSDQSFSVQVTIPPIAESLRAAREGAVGLWTVTDNENALMIKTPDLLVAGEGAEATIYHGQAMLFSLVSETGNGLKISMNGATTDNGLRRASYTVSAMPTPLAAPRAPARIVVTAI